MVKERENEVVAKSHINISVPQRHGPEVGRTKVGQWYRERSDKPEKHSTTTDRREAHKENGPVKFTDLPNDVEQNIRRSTLAISQLENVVSNIVSAESIVKEIVQPSSSIGQLRSIRVDALSRPAAITAEMSHGGPSSSLSSLSHHQPVVRPGTEQGIEQPVSSFQKVKTDSEAGTRGLSDAISRSMTMPAGAIFAGVHERTIQAGTQPMKELPVLPMAHVARAMTAIVGSYQMVGNYIGHGSYRTPIARLIMAGSGYPPTSSASMNVNRSGEEMGKVSPGLISQSPIISLINNVATRQIPATPGVSQLALHANPAVNLSAGMAAAKAAQEAGTSVIREFVRSSPSMSGNYNIQAFPDRNVVNMPMPGVTVERDMSNVNKTSSFHNTFNISITTNGGSEESDMKELGKKIGRILSDEIKRYGGA